MITLYTHMAKTVSRDLPIAEITLRKYGKPHNLKGRPLIKRMCLSMGLLNPGDSRDVVVDVFSAVLRAEKPLTSKDVEARVIMMRKNHDLPLFGITPPNIRRQIKRLRDVFLVERIGTTYKITENEHLLEIFREKIEQFHLRSILDRVKEYIEAVNEVRSN
jgi:hypothetical protein